MRTLKLMVRGRRIGLAVMFGLALSAVRPALADTQGSVAVPALSAPPSAIASDNRGLPILLDEPGQPGSGASATDPGSGPSPWWVWAFVAAGLAGVVALVATASSGKDPACPSDRVCH